MYMDEPESWNHFAIDSLNRSLLEQSAAVIVSLKREREREQNDAVGWQQFYRHTVSNRCQVFDVTCIALWVSQWLFPNWKQKQAISYSEANWRVVQVNHDYPELSGFKVIRSSYFMHTAPER